MTRRCPSSVHAGDDEREAWRGRNAGVRDVTSRCQATAFLSESRWRGPRSLRGGEVEMETKGVLGGYALARWNELRRTLGVARGELALDRIRGFRTIYRASISVDGITLQESDADPFLAVRNAFEEMRRRLEWRAPMITNLSLQ